MTTPDDRLAQLRDALLDTAGLDRLTDPVPVVAGMLYTDSLAWCQGQPKHGKSFVALDIAGCVGSGEPWHGRSVLESKVLYIIAEGASGLRRRVRAWEAVKLHPMRNVTFLPVAVQAGEPGEWGALVVLAREGGYRLIIIDTQARVTVGLEENSARDMGQFVKAADLLRTQTQACVMLLHHEGHAGEHMRGSNSLIAAADTIFRVVRGEGEDVVTVLCVAQKDAPEFDEFVLRLKPMRESAVLVADVPTGDATGPGWLIGSGAAHVRAGLLRWRDAFGNEWVSVTQLVEAEIFTRRTIERYARKLRGDGHIEQMGERPKRVHYRLCLPHAHPFAVDHGGITDSEPGTDRGGST